MMPARASMRLFSDEQVAERFEQGLWTDETWGKRLALHVEERGDQIAMIDAANKASFMGQAPLRLTWAELDRATQHCADALYRHGVRSGAVVGVQIPNSVELAITYFALNRLGAIFSAYPVQYRSHELKQLAEIAGATYFVTTAGFVGRDLEAEVGMVVDDLPDVEGLITWHAGSESGGPTLDLTRFLSTETVADEAYLRYVDGLDPHVNDCVLIMFTSGTTGVPKGVPRAHCDTLFGGITNVANPGLTAESVILNAMPMVNAGSIGGIFMPWLICGCTMVQHQPFDLKIFIEQIESEKVTYTVVAPTILNDMASDQTVFERHDLSSLKIVGAGSAPLSGWSIDIWEREHGVQIINFFGASEGVQLTADPDTVPDPTMRGRCLPIPRSPRFKWRHPLERQAHARLVDLDSGEEITTPGRPGELRYTSPSTFAGYLHGVGDPFDDQGYFCTGDIFELSADEPDMLVHVDRKKDLIIRGGLNISAAEVEALLAGHPGIAEVAAVGRKDRRLGERTCVFVVPRDPANPPSLEDLSAHLQGLGIATYKLPEFLELIDALPRNPSGKVLKRELRILINGEGSAI